MNPLRIFSWNSKVKLVSKIPVFLRQSVSLDTERSKKLVDCRQYWLQNRNKI